MGTSATACRPSCLPDKSRFAHKLASPQRITSRDGFLVPLDPTFGERLRVEAPDGGGLHVGNRNDDLERPVIRRQELVGGADVGMKIGHARLYGKGATGAVSFFS